MKRTDPSEIEALDTRASDVLDALIRDGFDGLDSFAGSDPDHPDQQQPDQQSAQQAAAQTQPGQATAQTQPMQVQPYATISAQQIASADIEPLQWLVHDILPVGGLMILAAPPKAGKSWLALDLALSVGAGERFLSYDTERHGALVLALEDSPRRIKDRQLKLLGYKNVPDNVHFMTHADTLDNGLLDRLDATIAGLPDVKLIVIDTLQMIRGSTGGREGAYSYDYRELSAIKRFADGHGLTVVVLHHTRKMTDGGDEFNRISGTQGITGVADAMAVIVRERRSDSAATLSLTGRDIESRELRIQFDKVSCRWTNLGDADSVAEREARANYERDPIVVTVRELTRGKGLDGWTGSAMEFVEAINRITRAPIGLTPAKLRHALKPLTPLLAQYDGIGYSYKRTNGNAGGRHCFYRFDNPRDDDDEPSDDEC